MSNLNYLAQYQTFTDKHELNDAIAFHIEKNNYAINETERSLFIMLSQYAVKYPGVAHLKSATIAKTIGKTDRTIRRAMAKLINLGMIERLEFMRVKSGGNGANLYRIVHPKASVRQEAVETTPVKVEAVDSKNEPITSINNKPINTLDTQKAQNEILKNGLLSKLPKQIAQTLGVFFDTDAIHRLYGVMLRAKSSVDRLLTFERDESEYHTALMSVISAYKRGKVRSLDAVLYEATRRTARRLWISERTDEVWSV